MSPDFRGRGARLSRNIALTGALRLGALGLALGAAGLGGAQAADAPALTVELNKLEPQAKACRAYIVVDNPSDQTYQALKLDLIFFRTDGVIDRSLLFDLAPIRPAKKSVKIFDLDNLPCDSIGSILVNDALECRDAAGPVADCMDKLKLTSRTPATLSK